MNPLYSFIVFIHIDFRLWQQCFYCFKIPLPVLQRNKIVCFSIGIQPFISNCIYVCFSQFPNHSVFSVNF